MRLARCAHLLLALALLAAWHGALVHPLKHADAQRGLVHIAGAPAAPPPEGGNVANALCDVLAALAVCVGNAAPLRPGSLAMQDSPTPARKAAAEVAPLLAYRSQAPPAFP